ncbi:MAG: hypothetical protein M0Z82_09120, partial [Actinomycetota bacterium]|nr:hypothetical protein [Actinomycetota bacterium]
MRIVILGGSFGGLTTAYEMGAVASSPGLANPKGFIPVDDHYRHQVADGVYAVGVAVALPPA